MAVASTEFSGIVISGSRFTAKLFLLPLTRILDISDADTLHDLDKYSIGSNGVCGGGIAGTASSSSISMPKVPATSLAFQHFSMAILEGREPGGTHKAQGEGWSRHAVAGRTNKGNTRLTAICSQQLSYLRPWRAHDTALKKPGDWHFDGCRRYGSQPHGSCVNSQRQRIPIHLFYGCVSRPVRQYELDDRGAM